MDESLPDLWIGRCSTTNWPACSPDSTSLEFILWGYVKHKVYSTRDCSVRQLKGRITSAIRNVCAHVLQNIWKTFHETLNEVIRRHSGHIEHL